MRHFQFLERLSSTSIKGYLIITFFFYYKFAKNQYFICPVILDDRQLEKLRSLEYKHTRFCKKMSTEHRSVVSVFCCEITTTGLSLLPNEIYLITPLFSAQKNALKRTIIQFGIIIKYANKWWFLQRRSCEMSLGMGDTNNRDYQKLQTKYLVTAFTCLEMNIFQSTIFRLNLRRTCQTDIIWIKFLMPKQINFLSKIIAIKVYNC
ncbi:hypothetical protein EGR_10871 [Echinococcus granulosus]|uniref:Uncharacterized protein n=1 Tax=Echinococcus granulosus TaxID=6210 RepID=W6UL79_ECHGR|nr:hypothetical protein EGR_10871 [Echinococcus granulosus]EUB54269.1 hypothetical protein EGR_10871 [Echinococcus granulosus]